MHKMLKFIHVYAYSMLVGFMTIVQLSLVPAQNRLSGGAYTMLEQGMNMNLETLTPILMITTIVSGVIMLLVENRLSKKARLIYSAGIICAILMVISTLSINAGVNFAIDKWNPNSPPADWMQLRNKWEMGHLIRTIIGAIGLALTQFNMVFEEKRAIQDFIS